MKKPEITEEIFFICNAHLCLKMIPQSQPRKKRNSSKVNLMISLGVSCVAGGGRALLRRAQRIAGQTAQENHRDHGEEGKAAGETAGTAQAAGAAQNRGAAESGGSTQGVAAPPVVAPPVVAPPAAELPSFDFDGGKTGAKQFRSGADLQGAARIYAALQMEPARRHGR